MTEQQKREIAKKLTFFTCLMQVTQNKTEDLKVLGPYKQGIKRTGNIFLEELDKLINKMFKNCTHKK